MISHKKVSPWVHVLDAYIYACVCVWALSSSLIQANEIKCNDIHRMLHTFGVEAARASIVTEVQGAYVRHCSTLFYTMPYSAELSLHCTLLYFAG